MNILGKAPFNPLIFYSGKIAGYLIWGVYFLFLLGTPHLYRNSLGWNDYVAHFCFLLGFILIIQSLLNLGKSTRFGLPIEETTFKTNGLYQISRNPMYLGINLWTFGAMIFILKFCVILLGVYSIIVYHYIILAEEKFLEDRFGDKYLEYKKIVRRYL
jgi:protein-S-isoprenylcysteine O-methyltransferase Ste14